MSDIAFNPGVGSGYSGSIDRTGQAAASTSRISIPQTSENPTPNQGDRIEFSDQAAIQTVGRTIEALVARGFLAEPTPPSPSLT